MTRKPQDIDRQNVDYERVRRRATLERKQVMRHVMRSVFALRARSGAG